MRTMKKITSVLLVTVILISALCSCELIGGKDAGELVSEAEAVLSSHPYTIDMVMNYSTDNADMQAVLDIMSKPTVKV